jgi:hypothetical protein
MATAPLGQPHQSPRSIALAGDTEGDSRRRLYFFAPLREFFFFPLRLCVSFWRFELTRPG